jgi:hypothetical protein
MRRLTTVILKSICFLESVSTMMGASRKARRWDALQQIVNSGDKQ